MPAPGAYRLRDIKARTDGTCRLEERGDFVEVIDGGYYAWQNYLKLGRSDVAQVGSFEQTLPCVAGAAITADFDFLELVTPDGTVLQDTVRVRIRDDDRAFATDKPVTGKPRLRWLGRGSGFSVAAGASATLLDLSSAIRDLYSTIERHELLEWYGWIAGRRQFTLSVTCKADPVAGSSEKYIQQFSSIANVPPAGLTLSPQHTVQFLQVASGADSVRATCPANLHKIYLTNTDTSDGTYDYLIGVRGA